MFDNPRRVAAALPPMVLNQPLQRRKPRKHSEKCVGPCTARRPPAPHTPAQRLQTLQRIQTEQHRQRNAAGGGRKHQCRRRQRQPPDVNAPPLAHKVTLVAVPMQRSHLRVSVARAPRSLPPLAEAHHRRIVARHGHIQHPNLPARAPHPHAELIVFSGNYVGPKPACRAKRLRAHHKNSTACADLAHWLPPFQVAHAVVDARLGMHLSQVAAHHALILLLPQRVDSFRQPRRLQFAIAIEKLDKCRPRCLLLAQANPSLRARAAVNGRAGSSSTTRHPTDRA